MSQQANQKHMKKLSLRLETLRRLTPNQLAGVAGGGNPSQLPTPDCAEALV